MGSADDNYPVTISGGKLNCGDNCFVQMSCKINGKDIKSNKYYLNRTASKNSNCASYVTAN